MDLSSEDICAGVSGVPTAALCADWTTAIAPATMADALEVPPNTPVYQALVPSLAYASP